MMRQLPGVFVVQGGGVLASFRHGSPADRPDYVRLVRTAWRALHYLCKLSVPPRTSFPTCFLGGFMKARRLVFA